MYYNDLVSAHFYHHDNKDIGIKSLLFFKTIVFKTVILCNVSQSRKQNFFLKTEVGRDKVEKE